MARLVPIACILAVMPAAVAAQAPIRYGPPSEAAPVVDRIPVPERYNLPIAESDLSRAYGSRIIASKKIAPNATIGVGLFGMKQERSGQMPVTLDVSARRSRKPAVGLSVSF